MHNKINLYEDKNNDRKKNGASIFQVGIFLSVTGILLLISGILSVVIFQVHSQTESEIVVPIVCCIGVALILVSLGNNCMIQNGKLGLFGNSMGVFLTVTSIVIFLFNYENNWYYPLISYILLLYGIGLILLIGKTVWVFTLSFFSSLSNQPSLLGTVSPDEHNTKDKSEGIINQKLSLLEVAEKVADNLQFLHIHATIEPVVRTQYRFDSKMAIEDYVDHEICFNSDDESRRRFETTQVVRGRLIEDEQSE